jgi:NADPH2:quinone reductase
MSTSLPKIMQAILLEEIGGPLKVRQIPVPQPGRGEVLVRMAASPINPSDLGFLKGSYDSQKTIPVVPGFEGSGTVVASGPGLLPRLLVGKRVACAVSATGGAWAEYLVTRATLCVPLPKNLSFEQGAMMLVNPMSALALFDIVRSEKHAAIANTAAASMLGRMILRLGLRYHVPVINIVRRQEQADLLRSLGAEFVLQSQEPNFSDQFRELALRLKATLILDAVGGKLARQLLDAAPARSTLLLYANLSGEELTLDSRGLVGEDKIIAGFYLGNWAAKRGIVQVLRDVQRVQRLAATNLQSDVQKRLPLPAVQQAMDLYQKHMTAGKVLLVADPQTIQVDG